MSVVKNEVLEREDLVAYLRENKELFHTKYGVCKIGIFGSYARNEQRADSDIDLLVEFASPVDLFETKNSLREIIGAHFKKSVDICRLKYVNKYAAKLIEREAVYV